jgi:short-subunit dehydrogenase
MDFKKIAITGHSRGIGKGLLEYYNNKDVLGFSRSNGYDLSKEGTVDRILANSMECEVFINNAYHGDQQVNILKKWYELHKNEKKIIVNISSIAVEIYHYVIDLDPSFKVDSYTENKTKLNNLSMRISLSSNLARSILISPGVIDTAMAHPVLQHPYRERGTIISVEKIVELITYTIEQYNEKYYIPQIYLINNDSLKLNP